MGWVQLGLIAGILLGTYDVLTKVALNTNKVLPVVAISTVFGSLIWFPFIFNAYFPSSIVLKDILPVETIGFIDQLFVLPKSIMMVGSWVLAYYSVKNLPLSISAGVRATGPIWTAIAAIILLAENLQLIDWIGLSIACYSYYRFCLVGNKEGIRFVTNVWVIFMLLATLLSSFGQLYDKYLIVVRNLDFLSVQAYSALHRIIVVIPIFIICYKDASDTFKCRLHWAIPMVGITMVFAEYIYLAAYNYDGAMVAILSILRRTNLVVVFIVGALIFRENNTFKKFLAIGGVVVGIAIISLAQQH